MDNRKKIALGALMAVAMVALPAVLSAQSVPDWQKNAVDWAQGGNIHEDWFMKNFLNGWKKHLWGKFGMFIDTAKAIAGLLTLVHFATKAYEMMVGDKKLEILPLLRPFGLCMIIIYWGSFIQIVSLPTDLIARTTAGEQEKQQKKVNNLRYIRAEYQYAMTNALFDVAAETEVAAGQSKSFMEDPMGSVGSAIKKPLQKMVASVMALKTKFEVGMTMIVSQILELAGLWILRLAVYGLFSIQIIYSSILIMFGPFSVAASVLPMFRDSLSTWISRFISVNLYVGIAYTVMLMGGILQEFAMQQEIDKYAELVTKTGTVVSMEKLLYLKTSGILSFGTVLVSFLISAVSMATVPSISTWIVSTSGATSAVSTMGRTGQAVKRNVAKGLL